MFSSLRTFSKVQKSEKILKERKGTKKCLLRWEGGVFEGVCLGLDAMLGPSSGISVYESFYNYFHLLNIHNLINFLFIYFVVFIVFHVFEISISYHPCFMFFDGHASFYGGMHRVRCALPVDG